MYYTVRHVMSLPHVEQTLTSYSDHIFILFSPLPVLTAALLLWPLSYVPHGDDVHSWELEYPFPCQLFAPLAYLRQERFTRGRHLLKSDK